MTLEIANLQTQEPFLFCMIIGLPHELDENYSFRLLRCD